MKEEFSEIVSGSASSHSFFVESHLASAMAAAHWHDHVELNMLLEGSMTYLFNGRQVEIEAGRLVLFWAAIPHQAIAVSPPAPLICIYLPLSDFLGLPIDQGLRQAVMQGEFIAEPELRPETSLMAARWRDEWQTGAETRRQLLRDEVKLAVRRLILDQVGNKVTSASAALPHNQSIRHTQLLTEVINQRFAEVLTLATLAKSADVHPTTANRAFREVLGISVMEYLTRYRLARAMQRLAETEDGILQVALECGFGSSARFYQIFKDRSGKTPREFRLMMRPKAQN